MQTSPSRSRASTMVQAPQSPSAHPCWVPVRRARVRSQSSTVMLGGALSSRDGFPFSRKWTAAMTSAQVCSITPAAQPNGDRMRARTQSLCRIAASAALAIAFAAAAWQQACAQAAQKVTVRFTWKLKGEYAPLFVALDKGSYTSEGLDVDLAEGSGAQTVLKLLAGGNETFGDMLGPFTRINHVDMSKIQRIQMDASARSAQFLTRKIDVMSVYLSNELPQLEKRAGVNFNVLRVTEYGLNLLGASMIVGEAFADNNATTVRKLLRATAKGYRDAMADPKHAAGIMAKYMKVPEDPDVLDKQVEATVISTNAPAGKPLGWQESADWEANLSMLMETGGISEVRPLGAYYTNDYLQ